MLRGKLQLQFHVGISDFVGLNTEIIKGLLLAGVVEHDHQLWNSSIELDSLMIAECFSESVTAVIAFEVDCPAPGFYQSVNRWHSENFSTLAEKEWLVVGYVLGIQQGLNCFGCRFVEGDTTFFFCFFLYQTELITSMQIPNLPCSELEQIRCAEVGVYAEHK